MKLQLRFIMSSGTRSTASAIDPADWSGWNESLARFRRQPAAGLSARRLICRAWANRARGCRAGGPFHQAHFVTSMEEGQTSTQQPLNKSYP